MPSAMEYDDFANGDLLSQGVKGRGSDGRFSADWFIYSAACFPGCVCPDTANVTKPKDITERVWTHTTMQDYCQERSPPGFLSLFHPPSCLIICAFTELLREGTFEIWPSFPTPAPVRGHASTDVINLILHFKKTPNRLLKQLKKWQHNVFKHRFRVCVYIEIVTLGT